MQHQQSVIVIPSLRLKQSESYQLLFGVVEKIIGNNLITGVATDLLATSIRLNAETKVAWY
jgi:hypothetical protein